MTSRSIRSGMHGAARVATMASLALAASLWLVACAGAGDDDHPDPPGPASASGETLASGLFRRVEFEALLSTEKIRQGGQITYDDGIGNGVVWVRNTTKPDGCTAQVINRWLLLTSASCIANLAKQLTGTATVRGTDRSGVNFTNYSGAVRLAPTGGWGLILLMDGMNTCHDTRAVCASDFPLMPENAVHQFFVQGLPAATFSRYSIASHGETSQSGTDWDDLRFGVMSLVSSEWVSATTPPFFRITTGWNNSARPCPHDSGSPLIPLVAERALHTGVAEVTTSCDPSSGTRLYNVLTDVAIAGSFGTTLRNLKSQFSLTFDCVYGVDATSGLAAFHCDNDGTLH